MSILNKRSALSGILTSFLVVTPRLCYAAPPSSGQIGALMEFNWQLGEVHPEQSRWQANIGMGSSGDIERSINQSSLISYSVEQRFEDKLLNDSFQERSPLTLKWSTDSLGNSIGQLYGLPVLTKFSPVFNASGTSTSSSSSVFANPWVWVGAIVIGVAASDGGGGGDSNDSSTNSGDTVVGGDQCDGVSGSVTDPQVASGCQVLGN